MPKMVKFIIGNKSDVEKDKRKVQLKEGKRYADQKGLDFFETSAMLNNGTINDVFSSLATKIKNTFEEKDLRGQM